MEKIISYAVIVFILLAIFYVFAKWYRGLQDRVEQQIIDFLGDKRFCDDRYNFYIAGHPYYWVSIQKDDLINLLKKSL